MKYLLFLLILLTGCTSTKYVEVPVETEKIKTEYITDHKVDSVYIRDSVNVYIKNDTIFIYKERFNNKYIYKTDTIIKMDSIPYLVETKITTTKEVNVLTWYQKILMYLGIFALGVGIFLIYNKLN